MALSAEDWEKNQLKIYKEDKKEYIAQMGIDYDRVISGVDKVIINDVQIDFYNTDSLEIVAMKLRNAMEKKQFIEGEFEIKFKDFS